MNLSKLATALLAAVVMVFTLLSPATTATASAQQGSSAEQFVRQSANLLPGEVELPDLNSMVKDFDKRTREDAWKMRNQLVWQTRQINPQLADGVAQAADQALNVVFPGLVSKKNAEARAAAQPAREMAPAPAPKPKPKPRFNTGPCPRDARVCVDIDGRRTWLQDDRGSVTHVASSMSPGKPGEETPRGTFRVNRKVRHEVSYIFDNAPMPYAIYFTNRGHAFHQGSPATDSAGCVRLPERDAIAYWNHLNIGDKVFIY